MILTHKQLPKITVLFMGGLLLSGLSLVVVQAQQRPTPGKPVTAKPQATQAGTSFHVAPGQTFEIILDAYDSYGHVPSDPYIRPRGIVTLVRSDPINISHPKGFGGVPIYTKASVGVTAYISHLFKAGNNEGTGQIEFLMTPIGSRRGYELVVFPVIVGKVECRFPSYCWEDPSEDNKLNT